MEDNLLTKIHSRLTAFRSEVVAKDMIVPAWVVDSIEEIEAAQHSVQRTACTCEQKDQPLVPADWHAENCPWRKSRR